MVEAAQPFAWRQRGHTTRIIIHESHTPPSTIRAVNILRANGRANGLLEVGYHYVIERDGTLTETRPHGCVGSHAPGANHDSIGICLAADHEWKGEAHTDQLEALRKLYGELIWRYGPLRVVGHDQAVKRRNPEHKCPSFDMDLVRRSLYPGPKRPA